MMALTARRIFFGNNLIHKSVSHYAFPRFLASNARAAAPKVKEEKKSKKEDREEEPEKPAFIPHQHRIKTEEDLLKEPALGVNHAYDEAVKWFNELKLAKEEKIKITQKEIDEITASKATLEKAFLQTPSDELKEKIRLAAADLEQKEEDLREHKDWLWRTDPAREKRARYRLEKVEFPALENLTNAEWSAYKADHRLRHMGKYWGIFDDVLVGNPFVPTVNLVVKYGEQMVHRGHELTPTLTKEKPSVTFGVDRPGFYTLMLVDADEPNDLAQQLQESVHWLVSNIQGKSKGTDISTGKTLLNYIPPHPSKGTNAHRFVFVLLEQKSKGLRIENPPTLRDRFRSTKDFIEKYNLQPVGFSFFRASWDASVTDTYLNILKRKEPVWAERAKTK